MLSHNDLYKAGELTQFVSIDLIVEYNNKYILGKRINNPAKDYLFVPGSKTFKGNQLKDEVSRITKFELGVSIDYSRMKFIGIFDHIYDTNFKDNEYGTHYVCNALLLECNDKKEADHIYGMLCKSQHSETKWMNAKEITSSELVHKYTKIYFLPDDNNMVDNVFYRTTILD